MNKTLNKGDIKKKTSRKTTNPAATAKKSETGKLHPRNRHIGRYDFKKLCKSYSRLKEFLVPLKTGDFTINFSDSDAVIALNKALMARFYNVENWNIPKGYLCPPIPGRADYVHYAADLLAGAGDIPRGREVKVVDIGTGASCIYPIIGSTEYGWRFIGSDTNSVSLKAARNIVQANPSLRDRIVLSHQHGRDQIFREIIREDEFVDLTMCNPPFYRSLKEVEEANRRKRENLHKSQQRRGNISGFKDKRNFGGFDRELWCRGGETGFLRRMAKESVEFASQVCWFTCLVSKSDHIWPLKKLLMQLKAQQVEVVRMSQGQKITRFVAWSFLSREEQDEWGRQRWSRGKS